MNSLAFQKLFGEFLIRLVFVPLLGIVTTLLATLFFTLILGSTRETQRLFDVLQWAIPISLGFSAGAYLNRRTLVPADVFAWVGPAILFLWVWFSPDPYDPTHQHGLLGKNCRR